MSVPLPPVDLEGHCSTIYDDTLYVLSPGGFQSLPLKKHAKWAKETSGVAVTGPACVMTNGTDAQAQFWVIGGTSTNSTFEGLQVYSFADKTWQTIDSAVPVMQGRMNHSATYLQDQQSILVYAGSQQDAPTWLSSETFTISTQPPYGIQSFTSEAPPANLPILQPWDTGSAVMLGGSVLNTQISIFSPEGGWQFLSTELVSPLNPSARGTIVYGSDGSKVMEVYDANVTPNNVAQIVMLGVDGAAAYTGETVGSNSTAKRVKRGLTLGDWPTYNTKNAPSAVRSDFSVVQDSTGLAVLAGGNAKNPVAIFDQNKNSWVDADQFFSVKHQQPLKPTHTKSRTSTTSKSSSTASSTTSHTASATAAASGESTHDRSLRTLGIILGVLCGIAVIFILALLFLRWRKRKKREQEGWLDEKNNGQHMSFQDRGTPSFMKETGGTANTTQPVPSNTPFRMSKNSSHNSLGLIFNKRLSNKRLTNSHSQKDSFDSTSRLVVDANGVARSETVELADIEKPALVRKMTPRIERSDRPPISQYGATLTEQDARDVDTRSHRNRSSGWSKYFATSTPTGPNGLSHLPSAYIKPAPVSDGSTYSNEVKALTSHSRIPSTTLVPAMADFRQTMDGQPLSHVSMHSPSFNDSRDDLAKRGSTYTEGQKGLIIDPALRRSQSDSISSYNQSALSSARTSEYYNEPSGTQLWTPTGNSASFKDHLNARPPSNDASYDPDTAVADRRLPSRGKNSHFFPGPGPGTSYRPKTSSMTSTKVKTGHSSSESSTLPPPNRPIIRPGEDRESNVTVWPKYVPSADYSKPVEEEAAAAKAATTAWTRGVGAGAGSHDSNLTIFPRGVSTNYYKERGQEEPAVIAASAAASQSRQAGAGAGAEDLGWLNLNHNNQSQTRL